VQYMPCQSKPLSCYLDPGLNLYHACYKYLLTMRSRVMEQRSFPVYVSLIVNTHPDKNI